MIIRGRSGAVTIRERFAGLTGCAWFVAVPCLVALGSVFVAAGVVSRDYPPMAACLTALLMVLTWLCVRLARMSVRFDQSGVTVRNFWRTRRLGWGEVSHLADGGAGWQWALRVVGRDGRVFGASGTRSQVIRETRTVKAETLTAISEVAGRYGVIAEITGKVPVPAVRAFLPASEPGTIRDAGDGTLIIYSSRHVGLYAGDDGITVRRGRRAQRIGWDEISQFRNGSKVGLTLQIVLRAGRPIELPPLVELPGGELADVIGRLAAHHDIPADLAELPPQPLVPGLFEDPWGEAGLRYWDGTCWSPLLPRNVARRAKPAEASWSELPVAERAWTYAADQAQSTAKGAAAAVAVVAALVAVGLAVELVWDRGARPRHWSGDGWFVTAASFAPALALLLTGHLRYRKIASAVRGSAAGSAPD